MSSFPSSRPICLSFAGVAGNFPFQLGAAEVLLQKYTEQHAYRPLIYAGLSSGSVIASMLALGLTPTQMIYHFEKFSAMFDRWYKHPLAHWFTYMREIYLSIFTPTSYKDVSGKLYIGYSVMRPWGLESRVISEYFSNEDLLEAICTSCHLVPYRWVPFGIYRGELACDGAFSRSIITVEDADTVCVDTRMVKAHVTVSDWFPSPCLQKVERLRSRGRKFVTDNIAYFEGQMRGKIVGELVLPPYHNPIKMAKRWLIVLAVVWLLWRNRRRLNVNWCGVKASVKQWLMIKA